MNLDRSKDSSIRNPRLFVSFIGIIYGIAIAVFYSSAQGEEKQNPGLFSLTREMESGTISFMNISYRYKLITGIVAIPADVFEQYATRRCRIDVTTAVRQSIYPMLQHLNPETTISPPDIFYSVRFYDNSGKMLHSIYMARNSESYVRVVIDGEGRQVEDTLSEWFETHIDINSCMFHE